MQHQALSEHRNFAALPHSVQLQRLVVAKQTRALEAVFGRLQGVISDMAGAVRASERLAAEAARLLGEAPSAKACAEVQPGGVSVAQLVEGVEDVWRLQRDDLAVWASALAGLGHTTSPQQAAEMAAAVRGCTGMLAGAHPVVLVQGAAAALR
ncbi:hypothetical protein GPECTOR_69g444 [Gonium pectorale]|uniref:Uncharacterized protein n=1 Tax=Gonium pectorale TaxID=33097 RepID=A0A150G3H8_GONPE|nr:hypothetical protein GPECTOR_69g444 [Gonium pectorale]|eukprot:KXZ44351.1 hypothetical protein GPECTOR_69g444 [Gonium pectorale]